MADQDDKSLDKDLDAGERALGTEARDGESAEQRRARRDWDDRLAPLALAAPPAEPPAGLFERISAALDGGAETAKIIQLAERRTRRWRAVAIASSGIAACLMVVVGAILAIVPLEVAPPMAPAQSYVALVTPEGGEGPAMIVEVDVERGTAVVRSLRVDAPENRSLELWRIPPGGTAVSLGLVDPQRPNLLFDAALRPGDTLAITVEPPGGAPGGVATGPVILSGPLIQTR
ncbi:anti-sigma factor [Pelagibius sp. CAU 1746]|uniref:anti-sigma factor n=1 Tax=Pelagibius sp. CAU 1746 TaxID=3140370 RepID=UPI00325BBC52